MRARCPCCGATHSLDALVTHDDARAALAAAFAVSQPLGTALVRYLALFRPATRELTMARVATLTTELLPYIKAGAVPRKGRDWPVTPADWVAAIDTMLQARDNGKLALPLSSHGYLLEVLSAQANKQEAAAEAQALAQQRSPARSGGHTVTVRGEPMGIGQALEAVYGGTNTAMPQQAQGKKATPPNATTREKIAEILGKKPAPTPATPPTPNSERPAP